MRILGADHAAAAGEGGVFHDLPGALLGGLGEALADCGGVFGMQVDANVTSRRGELGQRLADDSDHLSGVNSQLAARQLFADRQSQVQELFFDLGVQLGQGRTEQLEDGIELGDLGGQGVRLTGKPINPLSRKPIEEPLDVGIRAINSLLTIGRGQRVGLFAGSGVGKSVLLGMMARYTSADIIVVGLIGERGREVKEFVERILGPKDRQRAVVVAAPADAPPLMRLHGAWLATAIAEYFRDQGANVLLLMDSVTRFAQAQREIGLAIGEAPATKGYPPSVFARLPQLVERAGNGAEGSGSITAFYTVLTEGDDNNDPIADAARAILDGHIVLSRRIAESGQYPAIDIEASVSRVMHEITTPTQMQIARQFRHTLSTYQQNRDLIAVGAYQRGSDPRVDNAITLFPRMQKFLAQDIRERSDFGASLTALSAVLAENAAK